MPNVRSHRKPPISDSPEGGENNSTKLTANGSAAAISIGWRRPQRVFTRSDHAPMSGSVIASTITEMAMAKPTSQASTPTSCW